MDTRRVPMIQEIESAAAGRSEARASVNASISRSWPRRRPLCEKQARNSIAARPSCPAAAGRSRGSRGGPLDLFA
jgi:hypothetical protein